MLVKMVTLLLLLVCAVSCFADVSIEIPAGGFPWVRNGSTMVANPWGEFRADMQLIYALTFGGGWPSTFCYKVGTTMITGTLDSWAITNGVFSGTFSAGKQREYAPGTWVLLSESPVSGTVTWRISP